MSMPRGNAIYKSAAGSFIGGIEREHFQLGGGADRIAQRVSFFLNDVSRDHRRAFMQESQRDSFPQAASAAGNQSHFGGEFSVHVQMLLKPLVKFSLRKFAEQVY